jgi:ElaB/YqjD/DUF883 family membrane-anchored ribosome-binding protein
MTPDNDLAAARQRLLDDFGKIVTDTESLLRSLASVSGEKASAMRETVEANLEVAKGRLRELQGDAMERASGAAREADAYVKGNPWTAVGVAAAAGVIIGIMIASNRR